MTKLPVHCPSCTSPLQVTALTCPACTTQVMGQFALPLLARLSVEEQQFILDFFIQSGSLKEMAAKMNKSYPTIRNKVDDIIEKITILSQQDWE
jgi:hypothetical protein